VELASCWELHKQSLKTRAALPPGHILHIAQHLWVATGQQKNKSQQEYKQGMWTCQYKWLQHQEYHDIIPHHTCWWNAAHHGASGVLGNLQATQQGGRAR
jgi:hypothetical protein